MTKNCIGCGALFQCDDKNKEGYVDDVFKENLVVCKRCFRIKNYGDYQIINKDKVDYEKIFDNIKNKKDLVLFLCDILSLDESIGKLNEFKGPVILVITKKDLLPKSVKEVKLLNYIKNTYNLNIKDVVFVCGLKNYNLDVLYNMINKYKTSDEVYLVGNTNAGKSTLINSLIKSYSNENSFITTSAFPATTLDLIKIKLNKDLTLIDTPGLVSDNNYLTNESMANVKKISPKTEIKPRTFQMKPNESILIGDYARIDYLTDDKNSFTIYLSNEIDVKRIKLNTNDKLRNLKKHSFDLDEYNDIVINGLCFCKITKKAKVNVYVKENIKVFNRNNLI